MTWLGDLGSRLLGQVRRGHLAAFGKHPGWDDHLDDIGLDTEALLAVRQYLYVHGIGGAIDAGSWENRPAEEVLPEFKHVFVWRAGTDLLVGRIWSSRDGKNRTRFPMVLCAHFEDVEFERVIIPTYEALAQWESECRATTSAGDVRRIVRDGQETIRQFLAQDSPPPPLEPSFVSSIESASGVETLPRLAYAFDTYFGALSPGKVNRRELGLNSKLGNARLLPQHLRVPSDTKDTLSSLRYWKFLLARLLDDAVPILIVAPLNEPWIDLIAGPVTVQHLICLRMRPPGLPLSSDVPFTLGQEASLRAEQLFQISVSVRSET